MRQKWIAIFCSIAITLCCIFLPAEDPIYAQTDQKEMVENESGTGTEAEEGIKVELETEEVPEAASETEPEEVTEAEPETEPEEVTEAEPETETEEVTEAEPETEPEEVTETETERGTEVEPETEAEEEIETEPETEPETGAEEETLSGAETETEKATEAESETEAEEKNETDPEEVTQVGPETEPETEVREEAESESEEMTQPEPEKKTGGAAEETIPADEEADTSSGTWDSSWYLSQDFRFTQIDEMDKRYALVEGGESIMVYEEPNTDAERIGEIPYFGLVYVLDEKDDWAYIESGEIRGFVKKEYLSDSSYAKEMADLIGEDTLPCGKRLCEKADNAAFTYNHTTVYNVLAKKRYAITIYASPIYEYQNLASRAIGETKSGTLVYILETSDGWVYVESGDVRGFMPTINLIDGIAAKGIVDEVGEDELPLAKMQVAPEENRSCYYTLTSIKTASEHRGEEIAQYAQSFVGKLSYVWGGTSLQLGADCSGFVQGVYAAFGISIPRLAQEQGTSGQAIDSLSEAKPGDVVYYGSGPHVGIYIGNGKVVQCAGNSSNTASNPGAGPTISSADYMPITSIRRYAITLSDSRSGENSRKDPTVYTQDQMELIWAIVAQEDNGSYEGALAVISSAMNRSESAKWGYCGSNALEQLTAPGQYCYSNDDYWRPRLGGNVPEYVKQAVYDCLEKGIRNHHYTSFRSQKGMITGPNAVQIGGNWFFDT